jgi:hypothetical protein
MVYETYKEEISNSSVRLKGNRSFPTKALSLVALGVVQDELFYRFCGVPRVPLDSG